MCNFVVGNDIKHIILNNLIIMKYKIYSIWEDGEKYLYKETIEADEAANIIRNFIYGTEHNHKYEVEIVKE